MALPAPLGSRAVVLGEFRSIGASLPERVRDLCAQYAEVVVAIEHGDDANAEALPLRWATLRALLAPLRNAWVTPLVAGGLRSVQDRCAALEARLGKIDLLVAELPEMLACAAQLGLRCTSLSAEQALEPQAPSPVTPRALLVLRAQPFHLGHLALVRHALSLAEELVLVVAAAERAYAARDPFTAGERLALVRAGLGELNPRVWLAALPAPAWSAMALAQLAFVAPRYDVVVGHNPILRAIALQQGTRIAGLARPFAREGEVLSATRVRTRLAREGAGTWLHEFVPEGTAALLRAEPALSQRCALIASAES